MQESFLGHKGGRYLWWGIALCLFGVLAYSFHDPVEPPNGGTWVGYSLGTIAALLILWLAYYGRRKRNYGSTLGKVRGWLSAHVYLGLSLLVIATLHTGFQFGWNVHTLAYALMCIVILSGVVGVWTYIYLPTVMTDNNEGRTREEMLASVRELDLQILKRATSSDPMVRACVGSALERTSLGADFWSQLGGRDHSQVVLADGAVAANPDQQTVISALAEQLSRASDDATVELIRDIMDLLASRSDALRRTRRDIQVHAFLRAWLYLHIPLTFALLAALSAHIVSVFAYW